MVADSVENTLQTLNFSAHDAEVDERDGSLIVHASAFADVTEREHYAFVLNGEFVIYYHCLVSYSDVR